MTLPAGITTCTVTIGKALGSLGEDASLSGTLTLDRRLVWSATGDTLYGVASSVTASQSGGWLSFVVAHVDQSGFVDQSGNSITGFSYTFSGRATFADGSVEPIVKHFQVFVGQSTLDLDLLPDGPATLPVVTPIPPVDNAAVAGFVSNPGATKDALSVSYAPKAATYASGVAYVVGQLVVSGTTLYRVTTAHTSTGAIDLSKFAAAGGAAPVTSVNGQTGAVTVPGVLGAYLGQIAGATTKPGDAGAVYTDELWTLANFRAGYNTTAIAPSLTANGTNQTLRTLVNIGNLANQDKSFRLSGVVTNLPLNGWAQITLAPVDDSGSVLAGAVKQVLITNTGGVLVGAGINYPIEFDFKSVGWGAGTAYLDVTLQVVNNATSGTLSIANMSLKGIPDPRRPMLYGLGKDGQPALWQPLFDPTAGIWRSVSIAMGGDGALVNSLGTIVGVNTDRNFRTLPPDPAFAAPTASVVDGIWATEEQLSTGQFKRSLRANNNDMILFAKKTDGSYELRGNTHGGETNRAGAANTKWEADVRGDGNWTTWDGLQQVLRPARKFRYTFNTQIQRSDASSPFANVDHKATFFSDGMMRMDRTMTYLADQRVNIIFEWMSSHDLTVPHIGRVGNGLIVIDEVDVFPKVATPAAPGVSGSTTGGTLSATTYYYAVTALASGGETTASPATSVINTGSTSSNTLTWAAVTSATGYRIYRGVSPFTMTHLTTVGPLASPTFVDAGATALTGTLPPIVNRARQLDATSTVMDSAVSDKASWAVWYDPMLNLCFGNIFDREALAARPGFSSFITRLERGSGIKKDYLNAWLTSDGLDLANDRINGEDYPSRLIPSGTVWAATHWAYCYVPANPDQYHLEIAARATDLGALKVAYPNT